MYTEDTIAAIATPPGTGAIGVVRVSGPDALAIARNLLGGAQRDSEITPPREAIYRRFLNADGSAIDSGIMVYYPAPASYTGEHVVELQGHGGRTVTNLLLKRVIALGARQARPGEFTERAFLNGKMDLCQAEAVAALIESASAQAARSAVRSLEGNFSRAIDTLLEGIIEFRALVEGALDFPEEEEDFVNRAEGREKLTRCITEIDAILERAKVGALLREGVHLTISGRPNVGKSSLLNRLAGREAAIVNPAPGTTRDVVEERVLMDGVLFNITDTAGLRETADDIEEEGIKRAVTAAKQADILLLLTDHAGIDDQEVRRILRPAPDLKIIPIRNKIDLANDKQRLLAKNQEPGAETVFLSAKTGEGIDALWLRLRELTGLNSFDEDGYMARTRHLNALSASRGSLREGLARLERNDTMELLAEDLRRAQEALDVITGKTVADDILGKIFSTFCIGK